MKLIAPIVLLILLLVGWLLFSGCSTVIYRNGQPVLRTYADARNLTYGADGSFHADTLVHSKPTQAAFDGAGKVITAGGASAALFR